MWPGLQWFRRGEYKLSVLKMRYAMILKRDVIGMLVMSATLMTVFAIGCRKTKNADSDSVTDKSPASDMAVATGTNPVSATDGVDDAHNEADPVPATQPAKDEGVLHVRNLVDFQRLVLDAEKPVLVDFYADWCPPCKILAPKIEELSREYSGKARFVKVDTDEAGGVARKYSIKYLPTVMVFRNSKPSEPLVGLLDADDYRKALNKVIVAAN